MVQIQTKPVTDDWVSARWEDYLKTLEDPIFAKAKGYYMDDSQVVAWLMSKFQG